MLRTAQTDDTLKKASDEVQYEVAMLGNTLQALLATNTWIDSHPQRANSDAGKPKSWAWQVGLRPVQSTANDMIRARSCSDRRLPSCPTPQRRRAPRDTTRSLAADPIDE